QENARRKTSPGSTITQLLSAYSRRINVTDSNVARRGAPNTCEHSGRLGRVLVSGRFTGAVARQVVAQRLPTAVDTAADGAQLDAQRGADLLVGQPLDVAQHDRRAELRRQRVQCGLQVRTQSRVVVDLLGVRVVGRYPVVVLGQRLHADAATPADHVEEQVRGDAVQPALEGAGLVVLHR